MPEENEENIKYKSKKGFYWTFFNQIANNGLSFVVGIILARLLTTEDYGITALPSIFIALSAVIIGGGFGSALVRKPELSEKDLSTAFYYCLGTGILMYVCLFFAAPWIADFYDTPVLTPLIRVTTLTFLWGALSTPQTIILQRRLDFKTPARISITTNIIGAIVGVSLAYMGYGLWSLVIMSVVSSFLTLVQKWLAVRWLPKTGWSKESFRYLWNFGNKIMASAFLDVGYNNLTPLIIGKFYTPADLGIYNRARGYASLPATQGTSVIQQVTFPVLSKVQNDDELLRNAYRKMLRCSAFVIFPVMVMLSALAKPFIVILITDKWIDSVLLLQIICFSMMWYPIHAINLNLLWVKGRSDLFLRLEIWKKVLGLTVMACTLPFGLVYFVSAGIASSIICLVINTYYTGKLINVGFTKQMHDLFPTLALSLLIFVIVLTMNQFITNLWLQLILGGTVGVGVYIGAAILLKLPELDDVKYMLSKRK